jgi:hypothetical protein
MAKALRTALAERGTQIGHSDALELVARQFGFANWNMLAARIETTRLPPLALPPGWFVASHTSQANYRLGLAPDMPGAALIESRPGRDSAIDRTAGETAVLMQSVLVESFRGKRVRLSAELRTQGADLATIWLRADSAAGQPLCFDNMMKRQDDGPLTGTAGWSARHVVLYIPPAATSLHFGFFLQGVGKAWARGFSLEAVSEQVAVTEPAPRYLKHPTNLDFGGAGAEA